MFIVGLKRMERERGSGWLDCPNCHEHALQDVIDAMRFASIGFFRLGPVERKRYLICRRCGYRREATGEELSKLETMGRPLRRAVFVPMGAIALGVVAALVYFGFAAPSGAGDVPGITFVNLNASQLIPASFDIPQNWNTTFFTKADDLPPPRLESTTTSTGTEKIVVAKFTDSATLSELILKHFADQTSIQSANFPDVPPKADCTKVGDVATATVKIPFLNSGAKAEIIIYAFFKDKVGYTMTFVGSGTDSVDTMEKVAKHTTQTVKFGATPPPGSSPTATPSPSPSPSPSASPEPGAPTPSPTADYKVSCS